MANILGTLTDSAGTGLSGTLTANLLYNLTDDTTDPDSIHLPSPVEFAITGGAVDITLPESETFNIPYQFTFTITGEDAPVLDFNAVVPNVGTVQFSSLVPTGISNANLDTGALRVAKLIATDANLITLVRASQVFNVQLVGLETSAKYYIFKPGNTGILVKSLDIVSTSGFANWEFSVGIIDISGVDIGLPVASTPVDTNVNNRLFRQQVYNSSQPSDILGLYIQASSGLNSQPIVASLSLEYTQTV